MPAIQKATGYDVEHVVKGGERLPDCGGINVLHTPGHTAGHIKLALAAHQDDDRRRRDRKRGEHLVVSPAYLSSDPEAANECMRE